MLENHDSLLSADSPVDSIVEIQFPPTEQVLTIVPQDHATRKLNRWQQLGVGAIILLVTLIWGGTFLLVQDSIRLTPPFTFLALRFGISTFAMVLIFRKRLRRLTWSEVRAGSAIGVFLFAGYALQTTGLQYTSTSMAGFLTGLYVPLVPLLSVLLLRQWPTLGAAIGIVLSFAGLTLLSINKSFTLSFGLGEMLILGCALANALHIVSVSKFAPKADAFNLTTVQIALTALLNIVAIPLAHEQLALPSLQVWGAALFLGVVATAFTLIVMNSVQQYISSTRATLMYALEPVWTGIFGYFAGERLGLYAWIGCICILLAMILGGLPLPALNTLFHKASREQYKSTKK